MKAWTLTLATLLAIFALAGCSEQSTGPEAMNESATFAASPASVDGGWAVIANRGSGSISVIDAETLDVTDYDLPMETGDAMPEPMYVVQVNSRVFVGDRANDRVAMFDAETFDVLGTVPAGNGVFHMWADPQGKQLWVNNDVDNTSTVIDPKSPSVIATVDTPADLVAMGGKPHDVILGPKGDYAYVTVLGVAGDHDYVVQYDTNSFMEAARAAVGKDPHVSLARQHRWLYVPCQNSDQVYVFDRMDLSLETVLDIPGAHGAIMSGNGKYFYTSNLPGGGSDALFTISTRTNSVVGSPVMTPYAVPHNLALAPSNKQLFVTHSGAASDKVTVYTMQGNDPIPVYAGEVTVGLNPFGLAFVN